LAEYADHSLQLQAAYQEARSYAQEKGWEGIVLVLDQIEEEKKSAANLFHYQHLAETRFARGLMDEIQRLNGACNEKCMQRLRVSGFANIHNYWVKLIVVVVVVVVVYDLEGFKGGEGQV